MYSLSNNLDVTDESNLWGVEDVEVIHKNWSVINISTTIRFQWSRTEIQELKVTIFIEINPSLHTTTMLCEKKSNEPNYTFDIEARADKPKEHKIIEVLQHGYCD